MRILQYSGAFVGAQKQIEEAIHYQLKELGHESRILYTVGESQDSEIIRCESRLGNLLRRGLIKLFGNDHRFAFFATKKLIRYIALYKPDIVHLHTIHHGYIDYEMLFHHLGEKQIPLVYTLHDMWPFTGGCYHYTNCGCERFLTGCDNCPKRDAIDCPPKRTSASFQTKRSLFKLQKSIRFVAVSDWVSEETKKSMLQEYPLYTVWNAVEQPMECADMTALKQTNRFQIVGVAASWTERKGIWRFFELAQLLGDDYEILLVGSADAKLRNEAPENIRFLGRITDRRQLYELYRTSDLHVSMSLEETFGMTFVEAAFVGTRSIGFNSTAIPGVLRKVHGITVSAGDVSAVEEEIRSMARNIHLCRLSAEEQREIKAAFSAKEMAKQYITIYEAKGDIDVRNNDKNRSMVNCTERSVFSS